MCNSLVRLLHRQGRKLGFLQEAMKLLKRLSGAYYLREKAVVARGIRAFRSAYGERRGFTHCAELRRGVHRLEKGLIMRPRAPTFGADYILDAVHRFDRACRSGLHDRLELRWAHDVFSEYFSVVSVTPQISLARELFEHCKGRVNDEAESGENLTPFSHRHVSQSSVEFEAFYDLCCQRRSVRWFVDAPVPVESIERALKAALQAPSACNRQPFFFRYFDNPTDAARVAGIAMGTTGYAHQIPALLVLLGDWSCFEDERDRHLPYIDGSLAAMQLMLALETLGLASCPINWPDLESLERKMERELKLPPYIRPIMLIAVGYPDPGGGVAYSAKKSPESVLQKGN